MNWDWAAWGPTIVAVVVAIFTYGRITQTQDDHGKRLDDHAGKLSEHGQHLNRVDLALVRLEEYNRGFADATAIQRK